MQAYIFADVCPELINAVFDASVISIRYRYLLNVLPKLMV